MAITLDGTTGITAPGVTDTGNLSVTGTSTLTGSIGNVTAGTVTASGLVTGATGALYPIVNGTAVASTSGTSIDFTGIPSWAKRITVMFSGVSTSGTSIPLIQLGSTTIQTTSYAATSGKLTDASAVSVVSSTVGFPINSIFAANLIQGSIGFSLIGSNAWAAQGVFTTTTGATCSVTVSGAVTLSGALDRLRITATNGTDTFDAGSINILYE